MDGIYSSEKPVDQHIIFQLKNSENSQTTCSSATFPQRTYKTLVILFRRNSFQFGSHVNILFQGEKVKFQYSVCCYNFRTCQNSELTNQNFFQICAAMNKWKFNLNKLYCPWKLVYFVEWLTFDLGLLKIVHFIRQALW